MLIRSTRIALAGLLLLAVAMFTTPAQAAEGQHCVVNLSNGKSACFNSRSAATAGSGDIVGQAYVKLVTFYDPTGYGSPSLELGYNNGRCTSSYSPPNDYQGNLASYGWNNRASSVKTYQGCDVKLWNATNYTGASSTFIDASSNLGQIGTGWSNRAGSYFLS